MICLHELTTFFSTIVYFRFKPDFISQIQNKSNSMNITDPNPGKSKIFLICKNMHRKIVYLECMMHTTHLWITLLFLSVFYSHFSKCYKIRALFIILIIKNKIGIMFYILYTLVVK